MDTFLPELVVPRLEVSANGHSSRSRPDPNSLQEVTKDIWPTISWSLNSALGPHGLCEFILFPVVPMMLRSNWLSSFSSLFLSPWIWKWIIQKNPTIFEEGIGYSSVVSWFIKYIPNTQQSSHQLNPKFSFPLVKYLKIEVTLNWFLICVIYSDGMKHTC